jgi:hypothetical protein
MTECICKTLIQNHLLNVLVPLVYDYAGDILFNDVVDWFLENVITITFQSKNKLMSCTLHCNYNQKPHGNELCLNIDTVNFTLQFQPIVIATSEIMMFLQTMDEDRLLGMYKACFFIPHSNSSYGIPVADMMFFHSPDKNLAVQLAQLGRKMANDVHPQCTHAKKRCLKL